MALSKVGLYGPATTDTAAGDNAAIGYTAAEGLILTGQGSTSDITIKNDADSTIASVATGTTVLDFQDNVTLQDDKGVVFGTGGDWLWAAAAGEGSIQLFRGTDNTQGTNEGKISMNAGDNGAESAIVIQSGEGTDVNARLYLYGDQGDDTDDTWSVTSDSGSCSIDVGMNTLRQNIVFDGNGNGYADATWQDNTYDYAELFEWKTHLSNDSDINALWGKTVVLDGDKVKLAESGDEANVIGVIRPKGSTNSHGDGLQWDGKWKKDVWGNYETEGYTRVTWQDEKGYRHAYSKDRIPTHRLKDGIGEDKDIHKKESSFALDKHGNKIPVVVPSTAEEKTATNYLERTHHKGESDKPLKRRIYSDSYNPATVYNRRQDRLKEWVLIGMLGQVPVRDSAIIPTHWKKMKNLESGIDKYFIFNK